MKIPIISGIYRANGELQPAYPVNQVPTPKASGIGNGYLRPGEGLVQYSFGTGIDRAAIVWRGVHYRVSGANLISIDAAGNVTNIGYVGGVGPVTMDYGFDHLMIVTGGNAYYYDGSTLAQLTDPDLGIVIDGCWIDGYYLYTDGESLIVTELNNPFAVNPLKYGSSESDPDPVVAVKRIRTELYAVNRFTIEAYDNVGGDLFPFQKIDGAMSNKGAIGTKAVCTFDNALAFVGGGKSESIGVYFAENSQTKKVSTPDIDQLLCNVPVSEWSSIQVEARFHQSHQWLYVHLPDRTVVYDYAASQALEQPVWFTLTTTLSGFSKYQARNFVWLNGLWYAGNPDGLQIGNLSNQIAHHWGNPVRWEFSTSIIYNDAVGVLFKRIELQALTGDVELGMNPKVSTSYSVDGVSWSMSQPIPAGSIGNRTNRLVWLMQGQMANWRIQRFQGDSYAHITPVLVDAQFEALAW